MKDTKIRIYLEDKTNCLVTKWENQTLCFSHLLQKSNDFHEMEKIERDRKKWRGS